MKYDIDASPKRIVFRSKKNKTADLIPKYHQVELIIFAGVIFNVISSDFYLKIGISMSNQKL